MGNNFMLRVVLFLLLLCRSAQAQMGANLCPVGSATIAAGASGSWQDTATWRLKDMGGNWSIPASAPPTTGAMVYIPPGLTVTNHSTTADVLWIHVAGTLAVCDHCNTQINVHTIYVPMGGACRFGMPGMPVTTTAVVEFLPGEFLPGDWQKLSRGVVCHGEFMAAGLEKTAWDVVAAELPIGATSLTLLNVPLRWAVGDTILIGGTDSTVAADLIAHRYQTEQRTITAVSGRTVSWAEPLTYRHFRWRADLPFHCVNLTRNVVFRSRSTATIADRGHLMFMTSANSMAYTSCVGLGRTDKSQPVTDPRNDVYGEFIAGTDANPRARYADHVHRAGPLSAPSSRRGCVVDGSPGWGMVNHASNCQWDDCINVRCFGSGFTTEEGHERGHMRRCLSALNHGLGDTIASTDSDHGRPLIGDWGMDGSGFWLQGGLVEVSDCVSFDNSGRGYALFNRPLNGHPDYGSGNPIPVYLQYPIVHPVELLETSYSQTPYWLHVNPTSIPSGFVPQRVFARNAAYGNKVGLQGWFTANSGVNIASRLALPLDVRGSINDFTTWGRGSCCHLEYTRQLNIDGLKVIGDGILRPAHQTVTGNLPALRLRFPHITATRFDSTGKVRRLDQSGTSQADLLTHDIEGP